MERKTIIFLAISFVILGLYPAVLKHFYPDYYKTSRTLKKKDIGSLSLSISASSPAIPNTSGSDAQSFSLSNDVNFQSQNLKLLFNKKGGSIHEVAFPKFIDSDTNKPLVFLSLKEPFGNATLVTLKDSPDNSSIPQIVDYTVEKNGMNKSLRALAALDGIKIQKDYQFKKDQYSGSLNLKFENTTDSPIEFRYQLFAGSSIAPRHGIDTQYIEGNFFSRSGEKVFLKHIKESKLGKSVESTDSVEWVAIKDRHFSIILKPRSTSSSFTGLVQGLGNRHFSVSLVSEKIALSPHSAVQHDFLIYMGPNELDELTPIGLDALVNFGKLDGIGRFLVGALEMLHKVFKNYGLAIIILTALINVLLFPLTSTSYMSMKRMQLIQPQMNKLREQHKKNPEKLNKEMMELYKKHKVNPFGGCLPMILQTPVFIALYVALSKSVILINSKLLWIKDLSSPDRLPLPFSLPFFGNEIHVLPLVMCVAMFLQQKLTQVKIEGQDPAMESQQKMMTVMMPIMFGFIFYAMPSALVLYWLTNTIIMSSYQLYLKRVTLT